MRAYFVFFMVVGYLDHEVYRQCSWCWLSILHCLSRTCIALYSALIVANVLVIVCYQSRTRRNRTILARRVQCVANTVMLVCLYFISPPSINFTSYVGGSPGDLSFN